MSDLAAQLELSRNLYDELFSQTEQLRVELQQAQEERDRLQHFIDCADTPLMRDVLRERQQAIDALRELDELDIPFAKVREIIRAALVKLGEQP